MSSILKDGELSTFNKNYNCIAYGIVDGNQSYVIVDFTADTNGVNFYIIP